MRLPKLRTIPYLFALMRDSYLLTPLQRGLRDHIARGQSRQRAENEPVVAVQCVEDYFYIGLFSRIIAGLRTCGPLRVDQYSQRSLHKGSSLSLRNCFWNAMGQNLLSDWKWRRLCGAFADRTAYCAAGWIAPWTALWLWATAIRTWRSLKDADGLVGLTVRGVAVGDLIFDSYLRFKPAVTLDLDDPYLLVVIRQALKDVEQAFHYFSREKPDLLLTSYATYIQHGIAARVAAYLGVRVQAFSNLQDWTTQITTASPWHTRNGAQYKSLFSTLPAQAEKMEAARQQMEARLSGAIDKATSYMKAAAYGRNSAAVDDLSGMPVIFLHDFTDSVHIYRWILFHDFWDWICFTIDTLRAAGIPFAVKPHPNQMSDSLGALESLRLKYPDLNILPVDVSNKQLVEAGMSCAVTVYGTVASEMAFMGIPTISSGDNPHISFDFCHTVNSRAQYAAALANCQHLTRSPAEMRRESCAFYYMHNLHLDHDQEILRNQILELRRKLFYVDVAPPLPEMLNVIDRFGTSPAFDAFCAGLYRTLRKPGPTPA
jgi:hypothetical protein